MSQLDAASIDLKMQERGAGAATLECIQYRDVAKT